MAKIIHLHLFFTMPEQFCRQLEIRNNENLFDPMLENPFQNVQAARIFDPIVFRHRLCRD